MSTACTILIIDDSHTIRRLVDRILTQAGFNVVLAPTAEQGLQLAEELRPDMILLDHQLPGTTGAEVCAELQNHPHLAIIPTVISSTLRKQAYVQYADYANVVDMLPKPYTEELLLTTVQNALDTGQMVVASQADGTAVPEVVQPVAEADLSGELGTFSIREVLDLLNNGRKSGTLEIEAARNRYQIFLSDGRIQGIVSAGTPIESITDRLPQSLQRLSPVYSLIASSTDQLHGVVELLNNQMLDPRLLKTLLRHQAAVLLLNAFTETLVRFRFDSKAALPKLYQRLPLEVSTLALLIEGVRTLPADGLPELRPHAEFARQPIRGQNLDRAGVSAQQTQLLGALARPQSVTALAQQSGRSQDEIHRILFALELAELVSHQAPQGGTVLIFEPAPVRARQLQTTLSQHPSFRCHVVSDAKAFQILAQRTAPHAVVVDVSGETGMQIVSGLRAQQPEAEIRWLLAGAAGSAAQLAGQTAIELPENYTAGQVLTALETNAAQPAPQSVPASVVATSADEVTDNGVGENLDQHLTDCDAGPTTATPPSPSTVIDQDANQVANPTPAEPTHA